MQQIKEIIGNTGFEARLRNEEHRKKYMAQFDGSYVYYIIDRRTQLITYVGQSSNIVNRYNDHYHRQERSTFSDWSVANGYDKSNYEMLVLDLTDYEELDFSDRLLIEKMLQYFHKSTIINKRVPSKLTAYEIQQFEYIVGLIDFNFRPYTEVKVLKMNNKKVLSFAD